jgi:hypothetical protein
LKKQPESGKGFNNREITSYLKPVVTASKKCEIASTRNLIKRFKNMEIASSWKPGITASKKYEIASTRNLIKRVKEHGDCFVMESLKKQFQGAMRLFRHGNLAVSLPTNDRIR